MRKTRFQNLTTLAAGAWLILSAFLLDYGLSEGRAAWPVAVNFVLCGSLAVLLGVSALVSFRIWEEWLDLALGVWLTMSPWVLESVSAPSATWNAVICGVVIGAMGLWASISATRRRKT